MDKLWGIANSSMFLKVFKSYPQFLKSAVSALFLLLIFSTPIFAQLRTAMELTTWKFQKGSNDKASEKQFQDRGWETVTVPHDWAIYGPFDKEVDKQEVAIVQNGEKIPTEKTGKKKWMRSLPKLAKMEYKI